METKTKKVAKIWQVLAVLLLPALQLSLFPAQTLALTYRQIKDGQQGQVLGASTPAFVQSKTSGYTNASSISASFASNVTSGDIIAFAGNAFAQAAPSGVTATCVTGSLTVTDTFTNAAGGGISGFQGYGVISSTGACTVTVSYAGSLSSNIIIEEISGVNTTSPTDGTKLALDASGTAANSGNITTTQDGDYIFGSLMDAVGNGITWSGLPAGFTQRTQVGGGTAVIDGIQTSAGAVSVTATASGSTVPAAGVMAFRSASVAGPAPDTTPPSTPTNLSATAVSSSAIDLTWTAATDNVGVTGYTIYRGGVQVGASASNSYNDIGLSPSTQYTYTVDAYDAAGNHSPQSSSASTETQAQVQQSPGNYPWSGILNPSRAIDWSQAGIPGGIPDANWTQCGTTVAPYGTASTPASPAAINSQLASCPPNTYVLLGPGTFYLNGGISLSGHNNLAIRGQGANTTFVVFSGHGNCNGLFSGFDLCGSSSSPEAEQEFANWTAGFSRGATQITLSNSLNIAAGSTLINLDQQDEPSDTGNIWNCLGTICGAYSGGFARTDHNCASSVSPFVGYCSQQQEVLVTACSPSCNSSGPTVVTISPGLYMNNWRLSQSPGAWWANTTVTRLGVENLSADLSAVTGASTVDLMNCYQCWVKGIRSIMAARNHIWVYSSAHSVIESNYFYQSSTHSSVSYGIELSPSSSDNLIDNNICQQVTDSCPNNNGGGAGNVAAYNYAIDDVYGSVGWFQASDYDHAAGQDFWLREGNNGLGSMSDGVHGTHQLTTLFRNWYPGWEAAGCGGAGPGSCYGNTTAVNMFAASRYFNVIGNVLGEPGYYTNYNCLAGTSCNANNSIYNLGAEPTQTPGGTFCSNAACTSTSQNGDPLTISSVMRWGNWDAVNNTVRFVNSEVPSNLADTTGSPSAYANPVPASQTLPPSFYLSSKPAWWPASIPWPAIGPDVSGGNVTAGTGAGASLGGHVYMNPAMNCFRNIMGGPADGSGTVLAFDASVCYASTGSGGSGPTPPAPPTGVSVQ